MDLTYAELMVLSKEWNSLDSRKETNGGSSSKLSRKKDPSIIIFSCVCTRMLVWVFVMCVVATNRLKLLRLLQVHQEENFSFPIFHYKNQSRL